MPATGEGAATSWLSDRGLRRVAFRVEQTAPGGIEREDPGHVNVQDLERARAVGLAPVSLEQLGGGPRLSTRELRRDLDRLLGLAGTGYLVYVEPELYRLEPHLRSVGIEIDFVFGDADGRISSQDLRRARARYASVRGPVGWNRLLSSDQVERRLFPERTLRSTTGARLQPSEWLAPGPDRFARLEKACRFIDDGTLARTYADVAARLGCEDPGSSSARLFERALSALGAEIRARGSARPTISDVARIGREIPELRGVLETPIDMARRLSPTRLIDPFLG